MTPEQENLVRHHIEDKDPHEVPSEVNQNLCDGCTICCEHVALEIDEPEDEEDFQNLMWYVMHEKVLVYRDDEKDWYVEFNSKCKELNPEGLCKIHSERPKVCVEYTQENCEKYGEGSPYDVIFRCRQDVIDWVRANTKFKLFGYKTKY